MMINPNKIFKNSLFISSGLLVDGFILFLVFVLIARYLTVGEFGHFVFLISINNIFQIFASGGIVNITIREIARAKDKVQRIISSALTLSLMILIAIFILLYFGVEFVLSDSSHKIIIYLLAGAALIMVHAAIHAAVIRAHENMGRVALTALAHKLSLLLGVSIAIHYDTGMAGIATAYLFAAMVNWCIFFILVRIYFVRTQWCFDFGYWLYLIKEAVPLGISLVLRRITIHMDTFLLTILSTAIAVGLFNSAYRVTQMLEVAVLALSGVLFPVFSRLAKQSKEEFKLLFNHSMRLFIVLCTPIAIWLMLLSREVIAIAYGSAYLESAQALAILAGSLFFVIPGSLFFGVFSALNKQPLFLALITAALMVNGFLDYWLIPVYSYSGAAAATLITEMLVFVFGALILCKLNVAAAYPVIYGRCLLACALPGIILYGSIIKGNYWIIFIASLIYALLYLRIIFQLKLIKKNEWNFLLQLLKPKTEPSSCAS